MKRRFGLVLGICLLAAWGPRCWAQSPVVITEFMAANARALADKDRDYPDWIELFNASELPVNLEGWALVGSANDTRKWFFPSTNLLPGTFLVVFASGKNLAVSGQELHTDFGLNADQDYLALFTPEGEIASMFEFSHQFTDISYGVYQGRSYYFSPSTPRRPNGPGFENYVADTKFSHDRGFYTSPFDLSITTATPDATIVWTTNGTLPMLTNGFVYTNSIRIAGTTIVRAAAFKSGFQPSDVDTQTYLFLDDIIRQSPTGQAPPGWPTSWGSNVRDYGMDPDIVNNVKWSGTIKDDLQTIPSVCVVMDLKDLFNSSTGIYANASNDGRAWERKCSLELVYPDGRRGFQIDCGIRIRGGYSRSTGNPKHAFRFFFRDDYGAPKLKFPVFGPQGADEIDCFDLRTFQNYSWSFEGDTRGAFLRDQFSRDSQLDMGHDGERGDYYHLYLNGQYWGLFNTCERPEASYAASYLGGAKDQYDVIKVAPDNSYTIVATDGNLQAWTRLYNLCKAGVTNDAVYMKLQGRNPDGSLNPAYENLIDITNLVDYMLVILYGGNLDAPISNFLSNNNPNNWYGYRNRNGTEGFRFAAHDSEHTLLNVNENRLGPYAAGNSSVVTSSPQWVWQKMWTNAEFRVFIGDRTHKHFFNGGALTPEGARARLMRRKNEIDRAVVGESARWGDSKRATPLTRDDWQRAVDDILNNFVPQRTTVVLNQLKGKGLYPGVVAPTFNPHGGRFDAGFRLTVTAPAGRVYYTLDGSDPRLMGGAISPSAQTYAAPLALTESGLVRARVRDGTNWSALNEAAFIMAQTFTNLVISEIMYNPLPEGTVDGDSFEFLELKNLDPVEIDLSGVSFASGVEFVFPKGTRLGPGQFLVLVNNATNFASRYPGVPIAGVFKGNLANNGERLTLVHAVGTPIYSVAYGDQPPWPAAADGRGFSLVPANPNLNADPNNPANWRASSHPGGSPGSDDPAINVVPVIVNEVLTHTDPPEVDAIELYNPTADQADVSHWYLTDDRAVPRKFVLPATLIRSGGFAVFTETDFNPRPGVDPSFSLSSLGEEVFLYSADAEGNLTGYSDGFSFKAAAAGVTFGRYTNSVGEIQYPAQQRSTLGGSNAGPRVGPVVINEIHYWPRPGEAEFIEIKNLTEATVPLFDPEHVTNTWRLNGVGFSFPTNFELAPRGLALVVGGDPVVFRARYQLPASVPVLGPFDGTLQDNGELLRIQRPDAPEADARGELVIPFITVDEVRYHDKAPWPTNAAGLGSSLERIRSEVYGNDPINWRASFGDPSPGYDNDGNRRPTVNAGADVEAESGTFPLSVTLSGAADDDGLPSPPGHLATTWTQLGGPGAALIQAPDQLNTSVSLPGTGTYVFRLTAKDTALQAVDEIMVTVSRPPVQATLVPAGAVWAYWDRGTDLGTAWRTNTYDDSSWPTNRAQFGYGDGDEATVISYGTNSSQKFITYYFRKTLVVPSARDITGLTVRVVRDDGMVVYLNGIEVFRDNLPEGDIGYLTTANTAIGGTDESTFIEREVDPALLRDGDNLLAVEMHQCNRTSTDISFDLALEARAFPANRPPAVNAGEDQVITLPGTAMLRGNFSDDGLPATPGVVSMQWTMVSGPGTVTFANPALWTTIASFSAPGTYVLRLPVTDGAVEASDDVTVTVQPGLPQPPRIEAVHLQPGEIPVLRISFRAEAGVSYVLQSRDVLGDGPWASLATLPAAPATGLREFTDPAPADRLSRFYRLSIP